MPNYAASFSSTLRGMTECWMRGQQQFAEFAFWLIDICWQRALYKAILCRIMWRLCVMRLSLKTREIYLRLTSKTIRNIVRRNSLGSCGDRLLERFWPAIDCGPTKSTRFHRVDGMHTNKHEHEFWYEKQNEQATTKPTNTNRLNRIRWRDVKMSQLERFRVKTSPNIKPHRRNRFLQNRILTWVCI